MSSPVVRGRLSVQVSSLAPSPPSRPLTDGCSSPAQMLRTGGMASWTEQSSLGSRPLALFPRCSPLSHRLFNVDELQHQSLSVWISVQLHNSGGFCLNRHILLQCA